MLGKGGEELKKGVGSGRLYLKAMIVMAACILSDLIELALKLAVGFVFFALLVYSLLPWLGYGFNDETLKTVFFTGLVFVLCAVGLTVGTALVEFIILAVIEDYDMEEI